MCRLLGVVGHAPLPVRRALDVFYPLCTEGQIKCGMTPGHLDGWGISGFSRKRAVYFDRRAESAAGGKKHFEQAAERAENSGTPVLMAHFRKASAGACALNNTHPFHYRDWVFAHNGTVFNASALRLDESAPQGDTDSERFMQWMLEKVVPALDSTAALAEMLQKAREKLKFSSLTFLLSDGKTLWAYRDFTNDKMEKGETLADREKYYTLYWANVDGADVVCSEPLSALTSEWKLLAPRALMVFTAGAAAPQVQTITL